MPAPAIAVGRCASSLDAAWRRRPLVLVVGFLIAGSLAGAHGTAPLVALACAATASVLLARGRRAGWAAILMAVAAAGALRAWAARAPSPDDVGRLAGLPTVGVAGIVASDADVRRGGSIACDLLVRRAWTPEVAGAPAAASGLIRLRLRAVPGTRAPEYGDTLQAVGRLEAPRPARVPGGYDDAAHLARRGIAAVLTPRSAGAWRVLPPSASLADRPTRLALRCRRGLGRAMERALPPADAALLAGLVFGGSAALPPDLADDFAETGTAHLLAASGLNVGLVALGTLFLCRLARLGRRDSTLAAAGVLAAYTLATGARPAVIRADVMATALLAGRLLSRHCDTWNALAAAAIALVVANPANLHDPAFQLSFVVVAGIVAAAPLAEDLWRSARARRPGDTRWRRLARPVGSRLGAALTVAVAAQATAWPLTALHFHQVPLLGAFATLLAAPAVPALTLAALAAYAVGLASPWAGDLLARQLLAPLVGYLVCVVRACASLPGAVPAGSPGWATLWSAYAAMAATLAVASRARRRNKPR
ncbi:MAG: ComEC/Rec2 family competence protein [Chthonomonadales bacterium]|nr:ComEC/Rec2 family competence protein [Chthonomonadales bacterium]